jgi:hypothetical protein
VKVCLCGAHSNRTPFAYNPYVALFRDAGIEISDYRDTDFLIFGFVIDLKENINIIIKSRDVNPKVKIVVLSEEPLWDILWSGDFRSKRNIVNIRDVDVEYFYLNHMTTNIFKFIKIPYFITTSTDYIVRYHNLFMRNTKLPISQLDKAMSSRGLSSAFYAEYRIGDKYKLEESDDDIFCLSGYRTEVAEIFQSLGAKVVGKGWGGGSKRQSLADWHLDKLSSIDCSFRYVSAVENAHQNSYVTEKIFDAYASLAIPFYYSGPNHNINQLFDSKTYINLYGCSVTEAVELVDEFNLSSDFFKRYKNQQIYLADIFADYTLLKQERERVVSEVYHELMLLS